MDGTMERETGALGGLFQQIIQDMKNGMPLWEDFITKATKLHSSLKATILAVTAYLDSFQKIADSATNTRGATRDIGTALTRICLRHKAVENRLKNFTCVIMECLILPLQEKLEEWKKIVINLDKDHARDYKRARAELKKRSTDTLRLQKKLKKGVGGDVQKRFECGLQDVTERRQLLEETEKHALRAALVEERTRFCSFVGLLKPVVDEEIAMLSEMGHLQEAVQQLEKHTSDPKTLPPASEQVIADLKSSDGGWSFQTPPSSPSSLGSRKSSMCSISSINSSSSGSSKSHHSPSHPWQRSLSQPVGRSGTMRVRSVSSQDSGFMSQDTLFPRPPSAFSSVQVSNMSEHSNNSSSSSTPCTPFPAGGAPTTTATWPNLQETIQFERAASAIINDRPHTISSAYEKGHQRPPLTVYTFQAPEQTISQPASPVISTPTDATSNIVPPKSPASSIKSLSKPPLPVRCSSLERPSGPNVPAKTIAQGVRVLPPGAELSVLKKPSPLPSHLSKSLPQPTYANMHELMAAAAAAAGKNQEKTFPPPPVEFTSPPDKPNEGEKESSTSESSLESSSGYGSQTTFTTDDVHHFENMGAGTLRVLRRGSVQNQKPPPPIRRTSSITNTSSIGSLENLPPPPAFLLEPNEQAKVAGKSIKVAETVKALTELNHTPASPNTVRRMSTSSQNLYQTSQNVHQQPSQYQTSHAQYSQGQTFSTFQSQSKVSYVSQSGGVVYAQPVQVIGGSPNAMRRIHNLRSQSADRKSDGPGGVSSNFIASLSAKLTPNLSPKSTRRLSEDRTPTNSPINKYPGQKAGPGQSFLDSLNAKLSQQSAVSPQPAQLKTNIIRQIINSKVQPDPKVCHESLMDQIKKGATLRRAKTTNDRSAPKIC